MVRVTVESPFILDYIVIADLIIARIPALIPHQQGNLKSVVRRNLDAFYRTKAAQELYGDEGWGRIMRMAAATMKLGAGACHEYAAVEFLAAREALSSADYICYVVSTHCEHAFVTIGIPGVHDPDQIVVIDAWPEYPQALLWKDHFCFPYAFEIKAIKPGCKGRKPKLETALLKHYADVDGEAELARVKKAVADKGEAPASKLYVQLVGALCDDRIEYVRG